MGRSFRRFPLRKFFFFCPDYSCFNSCSDLFVFGSNLQLYFCPGQERGAPSLAVSFKRDLRRRRGMSGRWKFSFGLCIFLNSRFRFLFTCPPTSAWSCLKQGLIQVYLPVSNMYHFVQESNAHVYLLYYSLFVFWLRTVIVMFGRLFGLL